MPQLHGGNTGTDHTCCPPGWGRNQASGIRARTLHGHLSNGFSTGTSRRAKMCKASSMAAECCSVWLQRTARSFMPYWCSLMEKEKIPARFNESFELLL